MSTTIQHQYLALEEARKQLFTKLQSFTHEQLNQKPGENQWSILQVVEHLLLVETGSLQYMQKKYKYGKNIPRAGWGTKIRYTLFRFAFDLPFKWKAPKVASTLPEQSELKDVQTRWEQTRQQMNAFIEAMPERDYHLSIFKHPFAGRLNLYQTFGFYTTHFEHHLKQIERIKATL